MWEDTIFNPNQIHITIIVLLAMASLFTYFAFFRKEKRDQRKLRAVGEAAGWRTDEILSPSEWPKLAHPPFGLGLVRTFTFYTAGTTSRGHAFQSFRYHSTGFTSDPIMEPPPKVIVVVPIAGVNLPATYWITGDHSFAQYILSPCVSEHGEVRVFSDNPEFAAHVEKIAGSLLAAECERGYSLTIDNGQLVMFRVLDDTQTIVDAADRMTMIARTIASSNLGQFVIPDADAGPEDFYGRPEWKFVHRDSNNTFLPMTGFAPAGAAPSVTQIVYCESGDFPFIRLTHMGTVARLHFDIAWDARIVDTDVAEILTFFPRVPLPHLYLMMRHDAIKQNPKERAERDFWDVYECRAPLEFPMTPQVQQIIMAYQPYVIQTRQEGTNVYVALAEDDLDTWRFQAMLAELSQAIGAVRR